MGCNISLVGYTYNTNKPQHEEEERVSRAAQVTIWYLENDDASSLRSNDVVACFNFTPPVSIVVASAIFSAGIHGGEAFKR